MSDQDFIAKYRCVANVCHLRDLNDLVNHNICILKIKTLWNLSNSDSNQENGPTPIK